MQDWLQVALRTLFAIFVLFSLTKLLGKRQISQLSFFEYITGITIGNLAAYISLDMEANWYLGLVALIVWVMVSLGIEYLQLKSSRARTWIESKATILIKNGKILEDNLKKERITTDDILEQLRKKNIFKAANVEFAILEPSGEMNVLLKREHQPLTPAHLGIQVGPEQEPQTVIMDGNIMNEPLATIGLNRSWLSTELEKLGVSIKEVFLGQVDSSGQLYVDLYEDQIKVPESQLKESLLAQLNKCEADLELLGLTAKSQHTKVIYEQCSKSLEKVIMDIGHC